MTDSPVPPTFPPLTDLELAQITADLAPMGFEWVRLYKANAWRAGTAVVACNENEYDLSPGFRFSAGSPAVGYWTGFDSHISAATWLLLQDTKQVCPYCNGSGRVKHRTLGTSTGRAIYAPCPACIGEYVKV